MERKTFPAFVTKVDEAEGIIEAVFAVFGNVDEGDDIVHPGAFTKTFHERGNKVRVLDNHRTDSISAAIGKPLVLAEIGREQLPAPVLEKSPDATGGAFAKIQMLMDTPEGKGAFIRLRDGAVDEWSFGYDALDYDFGKVSKDGKDATVRNLRTLKLYEISPVLWGMNPATTTTGAKGKPGEGKPWNVFPVADEFCVFQIDDEGNRVGDNLGCHDTEEAARQQVEALFASEQGKGVSGSTNLPIAARDRPWDASAAAGRVRTVTDSTDEPSGRYRNAFFWFDGDAPENFGSYKLPFADVIDGRLTAIPRGVFAGAQRLDATDIPATDKAGVRQKMATYYGRMRRQFDDDGIVPPWEKADDMEYEEKEGRILSATITLVKTAYPIQIKAANLGSLIRNVVGAFYHQFPDSKNSVYWVEEIWDEFITVKQETPIGNHLWRVSYSVNDNEIKFAPSNEWIEGTMIFVPLSTIIESGKARPEPDTPISQEIGSEEKATPTDELLRLKIEMEELDISIMEV